MSLTTPTTQEINDNIIAQIEANLNGTVPLLPKSFTRVLAKVMAAVFILIYKYAGFSLLQQFDSTASSSQTEINGVSIIPLLERGREIGVSDPAPGTAAQMTIYITVTNQTGSLPANTQLIGPSNGVTYITLAAVLLNAAFVQATIKAVADQNGTAGVGEIGNLEPGQTVSFANPIANVSRTAVVAAQTVTGADGETWDAYRARVQTRRRTRPQGGAYADYRIWGTEPAGISQVFPYTGSAPGNVDVYVLSATEPDGIPTTAQLDEVAAAIELDVAGLATRRPAGALVNTLAVTRSAWTATVTGLVTSGSLAEVQADMTAAIQEYFLERQPFITGLDALPRLDIITRSAVIGVAADITAATGSTFTTVVIERDDNPGVPVELYVLENGELAKAGVVYEA